MRFPPCASWFRKSGRRWTSKIEWGYDTASAREGLQRPHRDLRRHHRRTGADGSRCRRDGWRPRPRGTRRPGRRATRSESERAVLGHLPDGARRFRSPAQTEDTARTIVTVWTKSGDFSFLVADLENGPILAPEYGFFVRRTSAGPASEPAPRRSSAAAIAATLLASKMDDVLGNSDLRGWGQVTSPWFAVDRGDAATVKGITFLPRGAGHASWQRLRRGGGMEVPVRRRNHGTSEGRSHPTGRWRRRDLVHRARDVRAR